MCEAPFKFEKEIPISGPLAQLVTDEAKACQDADRSVSIRALSVMICWCEGFRKIKGPLAQLVRAPDS